MVSSSEPERSREHDVLIDLGLKLQLELRRLAVSPSAVGQIDEVTDPFDDLAERVEVRVGR